jgi:nitrogen regulatory protein P-II 1
MDFPASKARMKRIEAIVRPHKQASVLAALAKSGVTNVTIIETVGLASKISHSRIYELTSPNQETDTGLIPKKLLLLFVEDDQVQSVIDVIQSTAFTGEPGDGKIAISQLEQLVRIWPKRKPVQSE